MCVCLSFSSFSPPPTESLKFTEPSCDRSGPPGKHGVCVCVSVLSREELVCQSRIPTGQNSELDHVSKVLLHFVCLVSFLLSLSTLNFCVFFFHLSNLSVSPSLSTPVQELNPAQAVLVVTD